MYNVKVCLIKYNTLLILYFKNIENMTNIFLCFYVLDCRYLSEYKKKSITVISFHIYLHTDIPCFYLLEKYRNYV